MVSCGCQLNGQVTWRRSQDAMLFSNFEPIRLLDPDCIYKFTYWITNSADPDQLASANWSGSTLFAKAGYIQVQQDKG